ncbi:MAG: 23S rRNA (guanosine(2251)-2'-O)-methyltransferase RlmB [Thermoleophilia bacterium]|nr:23S rRNA (guanosine(2251)-2'-O)-methyltransferase RlmB [Thermoleophilia bacterium]
MADQPRGRRPKRGYEPPRPQRARHQERTAEPAAAPAPRTPGDAPAGSIDPELLVYGRHPVREAVRGRRKVLRLHATPAALADIGPEVLDALRADGGTVIEVAESRALDALAGTYDHQGAVAETNQFAYMNLEQLLTRARKTGTEPLIFCLDQVTDPHNLGAIARVADASGATGILVPEHRSARVTGAAVKASAGALEHVLVARCTNLADAIKQTKGNTIWAYAATEHGTRDYSEVDLAGGTLLILGAEGPGIRPRVLSMCDEQIRIPMAGQVASLNVATVAAILGFEAVRQRRAAASS